MTPTHQFVNRLTEVLSLVALVLAVLVIGGMRSANVPAARYETVTGGLLILTLIALFGVLVVCR